MKRKKGAKISRFLCHSCLRPRPSIFIFREFSVQSKDIDIWRKGGGKVKEGRNMRVVWVEIVERGFNLYRWVSINLWTSSELEKSFSFLGSTWTWT